MTYVTIPGSCLVQILKHLPNGRGIWTPLDLPVSRVLDSTEASTTLDPRDTSATGLPGVPEILTTTPRNRHEIRRERKLARLRTRR